jgi:glutathione peroxidase-family protein
MAFHPILIAVLSVFSVVSGQMSYNHSHDSQSSDNHGWSTDSSTSDNNETQTLSSVHVAPLYSMTVQKLNGEQLALDSYRDRCLLVVNTASASILSKANMVWLNELQRRVVNGSYANRVALLIVPSDTFGEEPLRESALRSWFELMGAQFTTLKLTDLNESQMYQRLAQGAHHTPVFNNYNKYLVYPNGSRVEVFYGTSGPEENWQTQVGNIVTMTGKIEQCIAQVSSLGHSTTEASSRHRRQSDDFWDHQLSGSAWENNLNDSDDTDDVDEEETEEPKPYLSQYNQHLNKRSVPIEAVGHRSYVGAKLFAPSLMSSNGNVNPESTSDSNDGDDTDDSSDDAKHDHGYPHHHHHHHNNSSHFSNESNGSLATHDEAHHSTTNSI